MLAMICAIHHYRRRSSLTEEGSATKSAGNGGGNECGLSDIANAKFNSNYTMELHSRFKFETGLKFHFYGDDGMWIFLNNRLAGDLGGCSWGAININLDSIPGMTLTPGIWYNFDLFWWERMGPGSRLTIQTNMPLFKTTKERRSWRRDLAR